MRKIARGQRPHAKPKHHFRRARVAFRLGTLSERGWRRFKDSMKLMLQIQMDNAAFRDDGADGCLECASILADLAQSMRNTAGLEGGRFSKNGDLRKALLDSNGNKVGSVIVSD